MFVDETLSFGVLGATGIYIMLKQNYVIVLQCHGWIEKIILWFPGRGITEHLDVPVSDEKIYYFKTNMIFIYSSFI